MYIDAQQQYSVQQALAGPATVVSSNAIDTTQFRHFELGEPLVVLVSVAVGAVGGGTLTVQLQTDTTAAFGAPQTPASSPAIAAAVLAAGYKFVIPVPTNPGLLRWTRLSYILATMTGITVTAMLMLENQIQNESIYIPAGATVQ